MPDAVRPDARKTLAQLNSEWASCIKCSLGVERMKRDTKIVFGRGYAHSIMFIGEGPGVDEERVGEPFVGRSGRLLKRVLGVLGVTDYYLTNVVCCRSCEQRTEPDGAPMMRRGAGGVLNLVYRDEPPTPPQRAACHPRLMEEIYIVDPIVIVGLGGPACETLLGHAITITRDRGETSQIAIPGASFNPVLTEKRQQWLRKAPDGTYHTPVEQSEVYYHFVPTLHPAYVARELADKGPNNPFQRFVEDIRKAVRTYETYLEMVFGVVPVQREELDEAGLHHEIEDEE